jgi:hypothetical protein
MAYLFVFSHSRLRSAPCHPPFGLGWTWLDRLLDEDFDWTRLLLHHHWYVFNSILNVCQFY